MGAMAQVDPAAVLHTLQEDPAVEAALSAFYEAARRGVPAGAAMRLAIQMAASIAATHLEAKQTWSGEA